MESSNKANKVELEPDLTLTEIPKFPYSNPMFIIEKEKFFNSPEHDVFKRVEEEISKKSLLKNFNLSEAMVALIKTRNWESHKDLNVVYFKKVKEERTFYLISVIFNTLTTDPLRIYRVDCFIINKEISHNIIYDIEDKVKQSLENLLNDHLGLKNKTLKKVEEYYSLFDYELMEPENIIALAHFKREECEKELKVWITMVIQEETDVVYIGEPVLVEDETK